MSTKARIAAVRDVLSENARLLGEEQDTFLRLYSGGRFRLQMKRNGRWSSLEWQDYWSLESLEIAAEVAVRRSARAAELMATGMSRADACRDVVAEIR